MRDNFEYISRIEPTFEWNHKEWNFGQVLAVSIWVPGVFELINAMIGGKDTDDTVRHV